MSGVICFRCPYCEKRLRVEGKRAGRIHPCPSCQVVIQVPLLSTEVRALNLTEGESPVRRLSGGVLAMGLTLGVAAVLVTGLALAVTGLMPASEVVVKPEVKAGNPEDGGTPVVVREPFPPTSETGAKQGDPKQEKDRTQPPRTKIGSVPVGDVPGGDGPLLEPGEGPSVYDLALPCPTIRFHEEAEPLFAQGGNNIQAGEYKKAVDCFDQILRERKTPAHLARFGKAFAQRYLTARDQYFLRLVRSFPGQGHRNLERRIPDATAVAAATQLCLEDVEQAIQQGANSPNLPEYRLLKGDILVSLGDPLRQLDRNSRAIQEYRMGIAGLEAAGGNQERIARLHRLCAKLLDTLPPTTARYLEKVAALERAIRAAPNNLTYRNQLAWLLATCTDDHVRNGRAALEMAHRCCRGDLDNHAFRATLAAAYAETGDFQEADRAQVAAIGLAKLDFLEKVRDRSDYVHRGELWPASHSSDWRYRTGGLEVDVELNVEAMPRGSPGSQQRRQARYVQMVQNLKAARQLRFLNREPLTRLALYEDVIFRETRKEMESAVPGAYRERLVLYRQQRAYRDVRSGR